MKKLIILLTFISTAIFLQAQEYYQLSKCKTKITGTSTLHDWTADVEKTSGTANLTFTNGNLEKITALNLNMDAKSIKSSKGKTMDEKMGKTLNTSKFPSITFNLTKVVSLTNKGTSYTIVAQGLLTIAGTAKTVDLTATGTTSGGNIVFKGSKKLKMTDFKVEPPVMFLGTLKTADEVTIDFDATFTKSTYGSK